MSEGSNHNLTAEFRRHPDRAMWLVNRVLPAMKQHFEEFDIDVVLGTLTEDHLDQKQIKSNFNRLQKKNKTFQAKGVNRARPAYHFFCSEHRKQVKEENNDYDFGDLNKKLGEMWAGLSDKQRKKYDTKAAADKTRYQKEYDAARSKAIESGEFTPDPLEGIKKARTSYLCFSTDPSVRKKFEQKAGNIKDLMKILGEEWGKMSEKQRKPYQDLADQDKERYLKEKAAAQKRHEKMEARRAKASHNSDAEAEPEAEAEADEEVHVPEKKTKKVSGKKAAKKSSGKKKGKKSVSSEGEDN